jgi:emfourin
VQRVDVAALAAASPIRGREPDRFQYELMIEDDDGRREVTVSEDRVPEELRPLLDRVRAQG